MDPILIWNKAVENILSTKQDPKDIAIIQLFLYQVNLSFEDGKIKFLCTSKFIYTQFLPFSEAFIDEVCRLIGRTDVGFSIEAVDPNRQNSLDFGQQSAANTMGQQPMSQPLAQQPPSLLANTNMPQAPMADMSMQQPSNLGINQFGGYYNPYSSVSQYSAPGMNFSMQHTDPMHNNFQVNNFTQVPQQNFNNSHVNQNVARPKVRTQQSVANGLDIKFHINPNKTFENYVTDPDNKMLYATALKVATTPGNQSINPLYIHGASGLGKTHLLLAIANRIKQTKPEVKVLYVRAEEFLRHYVASMQIGHNVDFQGLYTAYDVFIVDDVQLFASSPKTRDTFFDIISDFIDRPGRHLVLASDVAPANLTNFSPRLTTRFGSGVCIEVISPCTETRSAIIKSKCQEMNINLPDDVCDYIAKNIQSNVRDIEGAIKTLNTHIEACGSLKIDDIARIISDQICISNQSLSMDAIKKRVSEEMDVSIEDMMSSKKVRNISLARSIAMTLIRELIPNSSLSSIGAEFHKDHSSVHEAIKKIRTKISKDADFAARYHSLELSLKKK
ncbi:Chromosomal replication initiator protein DnaA [Anaerobiospirillum thomasii]|uniref:Chromosomal replication initiator protein DnaA n=1 Tax=Anaerobiospirillum thomasii TaxID=179995 RepID=A0A2X0WP41_9GAMM|nr:chromosomal replication initiator protein DnaA [Anaerobiospirillum thomasii]SPT69180.1 Chromosomal replication initiator protein DnaA [Anaerobiospirillum thomasii]SPT72267.1 Chromosomal replication initiator protein DnaA [Anaerobiospirillum thomasii]